MVKQNSMHIILTHEQADFDALASLLGAYLLDESKVPVLPRRMNRNVRAFLTLYGMDLPFTDPRDLHNPTIEAVTLVDTQSLVSIKGMVEKPQVIVIDHHPLREETPEDWTLTIVEIGATTTLLVEALQEKNGHFTGIQATLLLLGIYEDTGSLTYTRTTARDLQAAAYLIEQGASLSLAKDFLNHPLSPEQQSLYDDLTAGLEHLHVHGHSIALATGNAEGLDEELSTLAHKLRDMLDPDALFLLIKTRGGIQMIARSTNDNIDVGEIADHFGGGGHERAAAALIRDRDLDQVRSELVEILPSAVRPAITVAQIMSRGPQLLPPDTPVEEVARRMRRYGYEGYPVVEDGQVVGLLTRRAVDRALAHKLNLTASSLMEAGQVAVHPDDSIEELQRVMTDSGWGQIPVTSPETGQIIGIVTRTDLLKILAPQTTVPARQNFADRLENALPAARLALLKAAAEVAHQQHAAIYIVGGFVRDLLLDRPSLDFDLVVEGDAIALARALAERYGGRFTSHSRFGTAKWHSGEIRPQLADALRARDHLTGSADGIRPEDLPESLDLVTARIEFYTHPTALPTVERGSIKLDLHRRDFTINTLALRLDGRHYGELHDYWGGLNDLRHGKVRVLHSLSFVDDPTRMLRAVRFEQRFQFEIEERTLELLDEARSMLDRVSGDRIRHELDHILDEPSAPQALARLKQLGLLESIHPDLPWNDWLHHRLTHLRRDYPNPNWDISGAQHRRELAYILWVMQLNERPVSEIVRRLKLSADLRSSIRAARRLYAELPEYMDASPGEVSQRLDDVPAIARYAVFLACEEPEEREILLNYETRWRDIRPTIDGHDLRSMELPPGPAYREILQTLRAAWLDGKIASREEEANLLEDLIREHFPEVSSDREGSTGS